jgi:hypothetical protein
MLWFVSFKLNSLINVRYFWGLKAEFFEAFAHDFPEADVIMQGWIEISEFANRDEDSPGCFLETKPVLDILDRAQASGREVIYHTHIRKMKAS